MEPLPEKLASAFEVKDHPNREDIEALRIKTAAILSSPNNRELEMNFRATCSAYQANSNSHDSQLIQAFQDYLNAYQQMTSLYHIIKHDDNTTNLYIYNTETETEEIKILQTPEPLDKYTCLTLLPDGKLFCYGKSEPIFGITMLIDVNGGVELLPSGTSCCLSSCIYFNNSVYCFGGLNEDPLTLSYKFDLVRKGWIQLTPMPEANFSCESIIFNEKILISGWANINLLRYSIESDSFTIIPYEFASCKRKILINAERLYLIESDHGSIYECEIGSDTNWTRIAESTLAYYSDQPYCIYNKGEIYIGLIFGRVQKFKFNLNEKRLDEIAFKW